MSDPKVKIAVLKNLLIFNEKYLPQSVRLLEGGGVETLFGRIPFEHALSLCGASLKQIVAKRVLLEKDSCDPISEREYSKKISTFLPSQICGWFVKK